jgi:methionine synthase I (cobalamin-dependent)/5,10-methylenetetrahydrofolate reductase
MTAFLDALRAGPLLTDGAMGSYLFERTGRLSERNHVYECLSLDSPEVVREVHRAYLDAGARCVTTNTFGANRSHLAPLGEGERVQEINRTGVSLARAAIEDFDLERSRGPYFVFGSVGPTLSGGESKMEAADVYREQISVLVEEGVDGLLLETFASLSHVDAVIDIVRSLDKAPPFIIQMSLEKSGTEAGWAKAALDLIAIGADSGADVVGVNCLTPWDASAFLEAVDRVPSVANGDVLLSVMPNGGGFQRIGHRYMTHVNPEYMGKLARTFAERGVRLIGGCCEVHPGHIREMANYLHALDAADRPSTVVSATRPRSVDNDVKRDNGPFSRKIKDKEFTVSVEILPPRGTARKTVVAKSAVVGELASSGLVDSVDITDGSRGIPMIAPGDFIEHLRESLGWGPESGDGIELIPHFTARDLNVMGLQSRLVGYHLQRVNNVVFITGDPPKMSPDYPRSTAVFDLDSVAMINYAHSYLNAGLDFGGKPLGNEPDSRTHFTIGSGFEPEAVNIEREVDRLRRKLDAGVDYIMTQPTFRPEGLEVVEPFREQVPVLAGVLILTSLEHAYRMAQIPGVMVPHSVYDRLGAFSSAADQALAGRDLAVQQVLRVKEQGWAGLYLMSPASSRTAIDVLRQVDLACTNVDPCS